MTQKLTIERWTAMAMADRAAGEEVIAICRLKKPYRLSVPKKALKTCFGAAPGVELHLGERVEVLPSATHGPVLGLPDQVVQRLGLTPDGRVCMTKGRDAAPSQLRRLDLVEGESDVPGSMVVDTFSDAAVQRTHFRGSVRLKEINLDGVRDMAAGMGRFARDPLAAFRDVTGRAGYLARKTLGMEPSAGDAGFVRQRCSEILSDQSANGSWGDDLVGTAFSLIRLSEMGSTVSDARVAKAARWLLDSPTLIGAPGLFAASVPFAEEFNRCKTDAAGGAAIWNGLCHYFQPKEGLSRKYQPIRDTFDRNRDLVPGVCELGVASASAVALQALLRLGFAEHPRVRQAINTFLATWDRIWCGHIFYRADRMTSPVDGAPDFDGRFPVPEDWTQPAKPTQMTPTPFGGWQVGADEVAVEAHNLGGDGGCSLAIYEALSWHPGFAGSNLEVAAAVGFAARQSTRGRWQPPRATMLHNLARLSHPLAALSVARTIPRLIRDQREDGLWPEGEEASFEIVRALSAFGLLDGLLPCG